MLERASSYAGGHVGSGQAALELSAQVEGPRARAGDTKAAAAAAAAKTAAEAERRILPTGARAEHVAEKGFFAVPTRRNS